MADISNIINVALLAGGQSAARDNMNVVAILTPGQGVLTSAERYRAYKTAAAVEKDWGTGSDVTEYANSFFATSPNPVNFGGTLIVGYYRGAEETVPATSATLVGTQLAEAATLQKLQNIMDGSFTLTLTDDDVTDETIAVDGLDFQTCTSLEEARNVIAEKITASGVTLFYENGRFSVIGNTPSAVSTLTYATAGATGSYVGGILGLNEGSGALLTQGTDAEVLAVETKQEGIAALKAQVNIKGACFIEKLLDNEISGLATWGKANAVIIYGVFSGANYLQVSTTNPVWQLKLASGSNFRALYSKVGNRKLAASYMARTHTVNFSAENSAMTMQLKELSVPAESYTQTELDSAKRVGLDLYTTVKDTPCVFTSHANDFVDNVYNLIAFIDAVQTDMFNLLKSTATKIPQTESGVKTLVDQAEKTTAGFVRAGVFAPGTWSSPDTFGDVEVFKRSIEQSGFYWLAGSLAEQSQAEREERKSPVLQGAVKNAGAIHSVDMIINFNK